MKPCKLFFTFSLLLLVIQVCFGQEKSSAVLVSEFNIMTCDYLDAQLQYFAQNEIIKDDSIGYIVFHGKKNSLFQNLRYERIILGRRFDPKRIILARGAEEDSYRIQLWKVSQNEEGQFQPKLGWDLSLSNIKKPYNFFSSLIVDDGICYSTGEIKQFAELLASNPNFNGRIVIYEKSIKDFRQAKEELQSNLIDDYKVSRQQLEIVFVKKNDSAIKYWLVPKSKK